MGRVRPTVVHGPRRIAATLTDARSRRRWALVLLTATFTGLFVARVVSRAEQARDRWGPTAEVLVVQHPVAPGDPLPEAVAVESWPAGLVPHDPVAPDSLPGTATAAGPLSPGTPLTHAAVADHRGPPRPRVAIPTGPAEVPVAANDTVDVWSTVVADVPGGSPTTRQVTSGATVVRVGTDAIVVAIDPDDVAAVAQAAALSTITLVATG